MKKKPPSNPFDDLMFLRDSVFVTELKKLVVPVCRGFSESGSFDTAVFGDMCALGGAMICSALVARYEDICHFASALSEKKSVKAAVAECSIFAYECGNRTTPYPCLPQGCEKLTASGKMDPGLAQVITRMGEIVLKAYADLPDVFEISVPKKHATPLEVVAYNELVARLSEKVYAGLAKKIELAANGQKGAKAKAEGDGSKKIQKQMRVLTKKVSTMDHRLKGYHDELVENRGDGVTVKSPANEKLINEILDEYGRLIKQEKYSGSKRRNALTDAMNNIVDKKNGYLAGFKDRTSLRSELGRERAKWEARYADQMTKQTVSMPEFGRK